MEDIVGVAVRVVIIGKVSRREVPLTILGLRQYTCPDRCLPLSVTTIRGLHKLGLPTGLAFHIYFPCSPTFAAHYPVPNTTGSMANPSSTTLTPPRSSILPASSLYRPYTINHVDPITMVRGRVSPECLFFHPTIPPSHHSAIPPFHHPTILPFRHPSSSCNPISTSSVGLIKLQHLMNIGVPKHGTTRKATHFYLVH